MRFVFVAATTLFAFTPALAVGETPAKPAKPPKEKKVCRTSEETGSRLAPRTTCKTLAEWQADRASTQSDMDQRARNSNGI